MAYLLYRFARQDRLRGVLAALPVMLLIWLPFLEQNPMWLNPEGLIGSAYLTTWITAGLAAAIILRSNSWNTAIFIALTVTALSGLLHSYIGIYHGGMLPFTEPGPSFKAVFNVFYPGLIFSTAVLVGPQLASQIRRLGLLCGLKGKVAYRAALLGMVLMLAVILAELAGGTGSFFTRTSFNRLQIGFALSGIILYTVALGILILTGIQTGKVIPTAWLVLFFWLPLGVPAALLIGIPFYTINLPEYAQLVLTVLAAAWVPVSIWTILKDPLHLANTSVK